MKEHCKKIEDAKRAILTLRMMRESALRDKTHTLRVTAALLEGILEGLEPVTSYLKLTEIVLRSPTN